MMVDRDTVIGDGPCPERPCVPRAGPLVVVGPPKIVPVRDGGSVPIVGPKPGTGVTVTPPVGVGVTVSVAVGRTGPDGLAENVGAAVTEGIGVGAAANARAGRSVPVPAHP